MSAATPLATAATGSPVHLVVCCHGLWGDPSHLSYLVKSLARKWDGEVSPRSADETLGEGKESEAERRADASPATGTANDTGSSSQPQLVVLNTASNGWVKTYDGIDWCSERIVQEIEQEMRRLESSGRSVVALSILGYSLGGLVARYVAGLLYSRGFFARVRPVNFATFATPHIGIPRAAGWFSKLAAYVGGRLLGRTGTQLYVRDKGWHGEELNSSSSKVPLLGAMSQPSSNFIKALSAFRHVDFYANAVSDVTVPLRTGGVMDVDPWQLWPEGGELDQAGQGIRVERDAEYPALLTAVHIPSSPPKPLPLPLGKKLVRAVVPRSWPWWLNPSRVPWRFPLNWLAVLFFPLVLPLFLSLIVFRLWSGTRESNKRVKLLQAHWLKGRGLDGQSIKYGEEHERSRIAGVLAETVQSVGEDRVEADTSKEGLANGNGAAAAAPSGSGASTPLSQSQPPATNTAPSARTATVPLLFDLTDEVRTRLNKVSPPLPPVQAEMQRQLNAIPNLRKHLAFFDGVVNSHAIIICRTPSMEVHRRGKGVIKHFVDHFEV